MDCVMRYVFSLCVFKQMGAHTQTCQASAAFIYSFKHSLVVKLFSHNQILILKVMGLYTIAKKICTRKYVFAFVNCVT